jgi:hypothetical protein
VGRPLIDFFEPLGISVELQVRMTDDLYMVGGKPFGSAGASPKEWDAQIDQFVAQQHDLAQRFLASITENAGPLWPGARAYYASSDHGFTLAWPDAEVGFVRIFPTHARVFFDGPTLTANYLLPGTHWGELKDAIEANDLKRRSAAQSANLARPGGRALPRRPVRVPLRILDDVPEGTSRQLERETLDASRRLRCERQMVYATAAVLMADFGVVRFEPIETDSGQLLVPFRFHCDSGEVEGGISLSGDRDPLRLEIYCDTITDEPLVWSTAIRGYAELATWNFVDAARHGATAARYRRSSAALPRTKSADTMRPRKQRLPRRQAREARLSWPAHIRPIGDTAANFAAHVAGHRRQLAVGSTPSVEARQRARQLGIDLAADETWVRPHVRGAPSGYELRFEWKP